jgi:hypothetical protein
MDSPHIARLLAIYERGIVTAPEAANSLLRDLMRDAVPDVALPAFVSGLPAPLEGRLRELHGEIWRADYRWKPFWIGPGGGGSVLGSDADDAARLVRHCNVLDVS